MTKNSKSWDFTINNYTEKDIDWLKALEVSQIHVSKETGDSGTPHLQGRIVFRRTYTRNALKKLHNGAHWEITKREEDCNYVRKIDSDVIIDIDNREQGKRTDLVEVINELRNRTITLEDIILTRPSVYHQYGRTLERAVAVLNRNIVRTNMTRGIWYFGGSGAGKSHKAFENYSPDTHYLWTNDNGWWDGYIGQKVVIMNDFRGEIPYNSLLQLVDKWPMKVKRRNMEPWPFTSELVIITSSLEPKLIYKNREEEDSLEQLIRRFDIVKMNLNSLNLSVSAAAPTADGEEFPLGGNSFYT